MQHSSPVPQEQPTGDALEEHVPPEPRQLVPPMTLALAAALIVMAIVQFAASGAQWRGGDLGSQPADWALGAKVPSLVRHGEYWRLVTANFLHGSWLHLVLNLAGLAVVGRMIEVFYGPARTFVLFVLSAAAGAAFSYLVGTSISLGASTGIMGLMGALVWHNWRYRGYLPARVNHIYPMLLALVAFQFAMDTVQSSVDSFGHVGGFIAGVAAAMLLASRVVGTAQAESDWLPLPTALATAVGLLVYGGVGLAQAMPSQVDMLQAGNARSPEQETLLLRRVIDRRPYFIEARLQLALQLLSRSLIDDARREYVSAVSASPALQGSGYGTYVRLRIVGSYLTAAQGLQKGGNPRAALESYQRVVELADEPAITSAARNNYAWLLADTLNDDLERAEQYAVRATQDDPNNPTYMDTLAWVYYKQGRLQKALSTQLSTIQEAEATPEKLRSPGVKTSEVFAELYYHLGAIYERLEKGAAAEKYYKKALERRPTYPEALAGLERVSGPDGPRDRTPRDADGPSNTMTKAPGRARDMG
jgi:membrane associated rhomboid family serine protease/Tfp pilus assembly protein PilF